MSNLSALCVFCGSSTGVKAHFAAAARETGRLLGQRGITLVYGGGNIGLMGIVADAVLVAGGQVIGVIPQSLAEKELAHQGVTELHIVGSMHERKALMAARADAFIALPGGFGTFEEFCEVVTWCQLGLHHKPCGLLNTAGFYDPLLAQIDLGVREGFIRPQHRDLIISETDPGRLLDQLLQHEFPTVEKWLDRPEQA